MDNKYITLFRDLAQATAATAEQVMDYDSSKDDQEGLKTATIMRDDYQNLSDRLSTEDYSINKSDAAKLYVAAIIQVNQLQDRISNMKKAMAGYQTDIMPKLQEIVDNIKTDEEAVKYADENFIIKDNK